MSYNYVADNKEIEKLTFETLKKLNEVKTK